MSKTPTLKQVSYGMTITRGCTSFRADRRFDALLAERNALLKATVVEVQTDRNAPALPVNSPVESRQ